MYKCLMIAIAAGILSFSGCLQGSSSSGSGEQQTGESAGFGVSIGPDGVSVEGPGVNVNVGGEDGVSVQAGPVNVDVNAQDGVSVEAPGTSVDVNARDGVSVEAPGANVDVNAAEGVRVNAGDTNVEAGANGVNVSSGNNGN